MVIPLKRASLSVLATAMDVHKYEWPGLDFISENVIPWTIRDVRYYRYTLQRVNPLDRSPEQLIQEAELLQAYGRTIGTPVPLDLNPPSGKPPTVLMPPTR